MAIATRTKGRNAWILEYRGVRGDRRRRKVCAKSPAHALEALIEELRGEIYGAVDAMLRQAVDSRVRGRRRPRR